MHRILIVVPTYNEAENIALLVSTIEAAFSHQKSYKPELLFVDDESPDGTADIIRSLKKTLPIHILSGSRAGLGKAYARGLAYGLTLQHYYAVVMMDADLSHDPRDIPQMLAALEKDSDYVIGSRYIQGGNEDDGYSFIRHLQSRIANLLAKNFVDLRLPIHDLTGGFKVIRTSALQAIPLADVPGNGYVFQVSLAYAFAKRGYRLKEVPITFHSRAAGDSKLGIRDITEFIRLVSRLNPKARLPRVIRFACVGASGAAVNILTLTGLVELGGLPVMLAYAIALETSIIFNFFCNSIFTFQNNDSQTRGVSHWLYKLARYNLVSIGGAWIAWLIFTISLHSFGLAYPLADGFGIIVAMTWNYWLSTRLVWRIVDDPVSKTAKKQREITEKA